MSPIYFSASTGGFYDAAVHGSRFLTVPDPAWQRPLITVTLRPDDQYFDGTQVVTNDGPDMLQLTSVPDWAAEHPVIEQANPDCLMPADVVEITEAEHAALLAGQAGGQTIVPDLQGRPTLQAPAALTREQVEAACWEGIKAERDRRTQQGGYLVGGHWFHSDTFSRTQQLGLVLLGANLPSGVKWKTMSGAFVDMTPALAQQVFAAAAASDIAVFTAGEAHRAAMEASADPAAYDISAGWPLTFEEA